MANKKAKKNKPEVTLVKQRDPLDYTKIIYVEVEA